MSKATYSIARDTLHGRVFWTDMGDGRRVSTVDLEKRDHDSISGTFVQLSDALLGRHANLETAVTLDGDSWTVVASSNSPDVAEANHRAAVESLLRGEPPVKLLPPALQALE